VSASPGGAPGPERTPRPPARRGAAGPGPRAVP